ncbi:fimbrial protein [Providencia huaxiensis]|uniref:Type 1 fimbrial protein n=1 Tax=Providencia huaxiensis TaxID=2027290 RepID=A0A8I2DD56_9GAMM|nr:MULTISPECIES: fimbrial protein [Providencia]MBQ0270562.1 type 1 fimbrial protein [Providencia huaxiensis]
MTKYLLSILVFSSLLLVSNLGFANSLVVYFEGTLIPLGCQLSDDDTKKKVYLSGLRFSELENQGRSAIQPFKLDLIDCSSFALNKTIKITFNAKNTETHSGITYLKTTGESNVLLVLTDGNNGQPLEFNKLLDFSKITESGKGSINTLSFGVYAQKPFNQPLKTGSFSTLITFNVDYQ